MPNSIRPRERATPGTGLFTPATTWTDIARQAHYRPKRMAQLCSVSFRTLQRHFRVHYHSTFTAWLRQHRMAEAHSRILAGGSLKEVCFDLGYKQPSHFTRVFKKHFGFSPSHISSPRINLPATLA